VCVYISVGTCLPPLPSNEIFQLSGIMSQYCHVFVGVQDL
jgi:hypothetical protein